MIERLIQPAISEFLSEKIILITGPRQVGKTTLSRTLKTESTYLNFDDELDRKLIFDKAWDRSSPMIIFDELHKMKDWKRYLKAVYDKEGVDPSLIVTGSARLDTYRKMGDSLAGRFFKYRLHPLDVKEVIADNPTEEPQKVLEKLMSFGGFPEPYVKGSERIYKLWQKTHQDIILRQDLLDTNSISDIKSMELLIGLLKERVGSPISYASLARDLSVDPKTVKRWLEILENLFMIYKVVPYSRNIARSVLKEPKYYFYDAARVRDEGARLENTVANALIKEIHFLEDTMGVTGSLCYLKKKGGKEVDFLVIIDDHPVMMIEVKLGDASVSPNLVYFKETVDDACHVYQVVYNLNRSRQYPSGIKVVGAANFLSQLTLSSR